MLYDTARVALEQLSDAQVFERVALRARWKRSPNLRLNSATGDTDLDGYDRRLFEDEIDVALWVSMQRTWTQKLGIELTSIRSAGAPDPARRRPAGSRTRNLERGQP